MMKVDMRAIGTKEVQKALLELAGAGQRRAIRNSLGAGSKIVNKKMKALARRGSWDDSSGATAASIGVKRMSQKSLRAKDTAVHIIGIRKSAGQRTHTRKDTTVTFNDGLEVTFRGKPKKRVPYFYHHLIRFGAKAHRLALGSRLKRKGKDRAALQLGTNLHPGVAKPRDFVADAWARSGSAARRAIGRKLRQEIVKEAVKASKKAGANKRRSRG